VLATGKFFQASLVFTSKASLLSLEWDTVQNASKKASALLAKNTQPEKENF
jgi:hypothetical protein